MGNNKHINKKRERRPLHRLLQEKHSFVKIKAINMPLVSMLQYSQSFKYKHEYTNDFKYRDKKK